MVASEIKTAPVVKTAALLVPTGIPGNSISAVPVLSEDTIAK